MENREQPPKPSGRLLGSQGAEPTPSPSPEPAPERRLADPRSKPTFEVRVTDPKLQPKAFVNWRMVGGGVAMLIFSGALAAIGTIWPLGFAIGLGFVLIGVFVGER